VGPNITIYDPSHLFKSAIINERGIELGLANDFVQIYDKFIEVGAVTPYYYHGITHTIIDPFDEYEKCVRLDAEEYDFTGQNVLCISTVEHMGRPDYGNQDLDDQKSIRFIEKILKESQHCLITWPIGANPILDEWAYNKWDQEPYNLRLSGYQRINEFPIWELKYRYQDKEWIKETKYNYPYPNGNGIIVVEK
jgi:hypothetical protein